MFTSQVTAIVSTLITLTSGAVIANSHSSYHTYSHGNEWTAPVDPSYAKCSLDKAKIFFPQDQYALAIPEGQYIAFATLGRGVQNYTCSDAGNYTSIGAVADMFDIACLATSEYLQYIPEISLAAQWPFDKQNLPAIVSDAILGLHTFVETESGIAPKFDFTYSQKDEYAFVVGAKIASIPAPVDPKHNVPWLQLKSVDGELAKTVFRTATAGGQPPATCDPHDKDVLSVQYAALYYFLK